jgi:gliding motility-associated-like protein
MNLKNFIVTNFVSAAFKNLVLVLSLFSCSISFAQSIVINEVSQGSSGNQEYVEFLVTGPTLVNCTDTPPCIDLRGYIFDDNNGFLNGFPTTGVGIAAGACRFSNDPFWACIPAGTLIVIYNDADPNTSLAPQDLTMADGNCMINVPVSSALFEKHTTLPSSANSSYSVGGWVAGGSWTNISMANAADGFQIYAPTNTTTPVFSIGWGPTNNLGDIYMGSGSAAGNVFYADDCDYFNQASWIDGSAATDQNPGSLNTGQTSCAGLMNANCDPPTVVITPVDETCAGLCDGSATATVTGGMAPYLFSWSPAPGSGQGTANISALCDGTYTLTLTNDNGNGCVLTETVTINPGPVCCAMTNTESFTNVTCQGSNDGTITLTQSGGIAPVTFSIDGGTTSQASGNFSNLADGVYDILIEDGSGCQYISSITINDGAVPTLPTFTAVAAICSGDPLGALPTTSANSINGTWSPAINNTATTTYTFTPTAGQCASNTTMTITVNPIITPTFAAVASICSGDPLAALPTTSTNSINGTWSPAINNTATTTYTFTPTAGQCASTTTMTITVNPIIVPTFTAVPAICSGDPLAALPTTSTNSINGTWSPALNNTATTTYTFTPTAGQCASTTTMTITVNPIITPSFLAVPAICSGDPLAALPTTSTNSINGTWSPAINNTASTTYTFTPTAGQCASTTTMTITVNPIITPTFVAVPAICSGDPLAALPTTSANSINGTWSPAINNTATTTYTFTPTAGQCASTTTMTITVNPIIVPTFVAVPAICSGDPLAALPTTSTNSINGTWSPAPNNTVTTTYTFTPTAGQCASTTTITITVNPIQTSITNFTICEGSDFTFPDGTTHFAIMTNESYTSTLSAINGCDSLITTNLVVVTFLTSTEDVSICSGDNYIFLDGTTHTNITANETYISTLASLSGCDSLVTTNLTVNPIFSVTENQTACENTVFTFPDGTTQLITVNTTHISNLITLAGCDSIITTNVTMNSVFAITENVTACENSAYTFPDGSTQTITSSLTHLSNLFTASGCDSIITTNVIMNPIYSVIENITICEGTDYTFPDGTTHFSITTDETYFSNFFTSTGCDSIITTNIIVHSLPLVVAGSDQLICDGATVTLTATGAVVYSWTGGIVNGVPFIPSLQSQIYSVTGTDAFGCQNTDDVQIDVTPILNPFFDADITVGCAPLTVTFNNLTTGGASCVWDFGTGATSAGCGTQTFTYSSPGIFNVSLMITDAAGCTYTNTLLDYINVNDAPHASFQPDQYILDDLDTEVEFTNNSTGASSYEWQFGDGSALTTIENPSHFFPTQGQNSTYVVSLIATNGNACTDTAQVVITVQDIIIFYVPNVFTPDGDDFNEIFQPVFVSGYDPYDFHLLIFNRWGEPIFESFNADIGWSGTYSDQGLVEDGVYVWKIEFRESMSDKRHNHTGHVTVLK